MSNRFLVVCGGTGYKLLGQRTVLGIDGELQIDVTRENVSRDWRVKDQRSLFVDLDERIGTTAVAFNALQKEFNNTKGDNPGKSNVNFLTKYFPAAQNLEFGLAQSPAVGNAAIRHPYNRKKLEETLRKLISQFGRDIGPQNPVEAWIVSSTAGGTGEGTHRFAANILAKIVHETFVDTSLSLNFIRVGPLTYRSINSHATALNTFFGVSADSAYMLKMRDEYPWATSHWFYVDLPDVGKGDRAKRVRGEVVEMACKSIMLPDLQQDLQVLTVNNKGAPIVLVRTGYWGKDFGSQQKYFETLKQLLEKLGNLVEPNYSQKYVQERSIPQFSSTALDDRLRDVQNSKFVFSRMEKGGWQFPRYRISGVPKSINQIETAISDWNLSMNDLLEMDISQLDMEYRINEAVVVGETTQMQSNRLSVPSTIEDNKDWFINVDSAHRGKAWAMHLLGMDFRDRTLKGTGLISDLLKFAESLSQVYHGFDFLSGSDARAKKASAILGPFLRTLAQVNFLLNLEHAASNLLDRELSEIKDVQKKAKEEFEIAKATIGIAPTDLMVNAADLSHVLDLLSGKNWLRLLRDAARRGDLDQFKYEVLRGATGLTKIGLSHVLGLQKADIIDVQNTLTNKMGRILDEAGEENEGQWWQATPPTQTLEYYYRILPQVNRELREQLRSQAEKDNIPFRYVFTEFGTIGLYVLAFHGVSLNEKTGDTVTAPTFLLRPLVSHVQDALKNWPTDPKPNTVCGQLEIVTAGTVGEPLYERAMRSAGLTDLEIAKIQQFYELYN